jgi:NADPH-dependent ferric siderophore reductase
VVVHEVSQLTPRTVRVLATGELGGWEPGGPGAHFKVFVPHGDGETAMRTYTVRKFEPQADALTVDFVLHGSGPASDWARQAQAGDRFQVSGRARSGFVPEGWCVLAGDESALPAIAAIAESAPRSARIVALVEVPDSDEELKLESSANLAVEWLHRDGQAPSETLVSAFERLEFPSGEGQVWVGCEASAMRRIRRSALEERGLAPRALHTRAYWRLGVADYPDHDTGED